MAHSPGEMKDTVIRLCQVASDMENIQTRCLLTTSVYYCHTNLLSIEEMTRITGMVGR